MNKLILGGLTAAFLAGPLAVTASATTHVDPCPGKHIQVWSEVGNNGAGQATNHFVCGPIKGADGKDGKDGTNGVDGKDGATGPQGPAGPAGPQGPEGTPGADGEDGTNGVNGKDGVDGKDGENGEDGATGAQGPAGADGLPGAPGAVGLVGPAGPAGATGLTGAPGKPGKDGVTKTVIVREDGSTEEVPGLPATGGDSDTALWLILGGVGIVGLGTIAYVYGKRN